MPPTLKGRHEKLIRELLLGRGGTESESGGSRAACPSETSTPPALKGRHDSDERILEPRLGRGGAESRDPVRVLPLLPLPAAAGTTRDPAGCGCGLAGSMEAALEKERRGHGTSASAAARGSARAAYARAERTRAAASALHGRRGLVTLAPGNEPPAWDRRVIDERTRRMPSLTLMRATVGPAPPRATREATSTLALARALSAAPAGKGRPAPVTAGAFTAAPGPEPPGKESGPLSISASRYSWEQKTPPGGAACSKHVT